MNHGELEQLESEIGFSVVSSQVKRNIFNECRDLLAGDFMSRSTCAVCDELVRTQDSALQTITDDFAARCVNRVDD